MPFPPVASFNAYLRGILRPASSRRFLLNAYINSAFGLIVASADKLSFAISTTTHFSAVCCYYCLASSLSSCCFQMADWDSLMQLVVLPHLLQASEAVREGFINRYKDLLFPQQGISTLQNPWRTYRGITRVTMWGREHFRNNIRLAMVKEALGLGPRFYWIERALMHGFSERLFLLAQFIPYRKMYLAPHFGLSLTGPFNASIQTREVGFTISQQLIPMDERPPICPVCPFGLCDHVIDEIDDL